MLNEFPRASRRMSVAASLFAFCFIFATGCASGPAPAEPSETTCACASCDCAGADGCKDCGADGCKDCGADCCKDCGQEHSHDHSQATPVAPASDLPEKMQGLHLAQLQVLGMSCPLCAHNISQQLEKIAAVQATHIDLGSGTVYVGLSETETWPSVDKLKAAVDKAGYTVAGATIPPFETEDAKAKSAQAKEGA